MVQMTDAKRKERYVDVSEEVLDKKLNEIYAAGKGESHTEGLRSVYRAGQGTYETDQEPPRPIYAGPERRDPEAPGKHVSKGRRWDDPK